MKFRTLLLGVGFALFLVTAQAVDPQVYFSRTDPVAKVLAREIDAAQKSIYLLIYSLTDDNLADAADYLADAPGFMRSFGDFGQHDRP